MCVCGLMDEWEDLARVLLIDVNKARAGVGLYGTSVHLACVHRLGNQIIEMILRFTLDARQSDQSISLSFSSALQSMTR